MLLPMGTNTLASTVLEILDDFQVPMPTATVRVVATARRPNGVGAESLSRLAAAQREEFARSRMPPRLCHVLDEHARALTPRVWARGDWRIARRLATGDALSGWQAALAVGLCNEMVRFGHNAPPALGRVTLEALARVIGPIATYLPGSPEEWRQLRSQASAFLPGPGIATHTTQQQLAEERLTKRVPPMPAIALYFGIGDDDPMVQSDDEPALLRLPSDEDDGEAFDAVLLRRVGGSPRRYRDLSAYLQGYSHLMDELGRAPTSDEFASHWRFSLASVHNDEATFRAAFPEERNPERLLRLLDQALPRGGGLAWLLEGRVVDPSPAPPSGVVPAVGQKWRSPDGQVEATVIEVSGSQLTVGLHQHGTTALQILSLSAFSEWELVTPESVWWVGFDVDVIPATLIEPLRQGGITADRLARPGDPRTAGDRMVLPVGTVEGYVVASDETDARLKVVHALAGHAQIKAEDVRVRQLPTQAILD